MKQASSRISVRLIPTSRTDNFTSLQYFNLQFKKKHRIFIFNIQIMIHIGMDGYKIYVHVELLKC